MPKTPSKAKAPAGDSAEPSTPSKRVLLVAANDEQIAKYLAAVRAGNLDAADEVIVAVAYLSHGEAIATRRKALKEDPKADIPQPSWGDALIAARAALDSTLPPEPPQPATPAPAAESAPAPVPASN